jgi:hypothetical protein
MTDFRALCTELTDTLDYWLKNSNLTDSDARDLVQEARAALAQPEQDDKTLKSIRATTPRYRMSVIVSTNDSAIDTRMNVIWQALDLSKEILESVSLPEQLPPLGTP